MFRFYCYVFLGFGCWLMLPTARKNGSRFMTATKNSYISVTEFKLVLYNILHINKKLQKTCFVFCVSFVLWTALDVFTIVNNTRLVNMATHVSCNFNHNRGGVCQTHPEDVCQTSRERLVDCQNTPRILYLIHTSVATSALISKYYVSDT